MLRRLSLWIIIVVGLTGLHRPARGAELFVDSTNGYDGNDGLAPANVTATNGPVRTLRRALQLARPTDRINLPGNGSPFFEPLQLAGGRHSGTESQPFTINGNGATLSGLRELPPDGWQQQEPGLWRLSLTRKGTYRFLRDNQPLAEYLPEGRGSLDDLPLDQFFSRHGAVYFRLDEQNPPYTQPWLYAAEEIGLSLVSVRHVRIVNLNVVGFRVDGLNADGNCRRVALENVTLEQNGRAGLSANGTSQVFVTNSRVLNNGRHSVLVTESGRVDLDNCDLGGVEPTVVE
jgi:hypothetical protein